MSIVDRGRLLANIERIKRHGRDAEQVKGSGKIIDIWGIVNRWKGLRAESGDRRIIGMKFFVIFWICLTSCYRL